MNDYIYQAKRLPDQRHIKTACYQRERKIKRLSTFCCHYKAGKSSDIMYGILYEDRSCIIGLDVWRLLNRMDTCQYPYRKYNSIEEAGITLINIPKAYYIEK